MHAYNMMGMPCLEMTLTKVTGSEFGEIREIVRHLVKLSEGGFHACVVLPRKAEVIPLVP